MVTLVFHARLPATPINNRGNLKVLGRPPKPARESAGLHIFIGVVDTLGGLFSQRILSKTVKDESPSESGSAAGKTTHEGAHNMSEHTSKPEVLKDDVSGALAFYRRTSRGGCPATDPFFRRALGLIQARRLVPAGLQVVF